MTLRRTGQTQGAEADTCFYVQNAARIIGKRSLDFNTDPPPDIVVEIDLTNASQHKFPIYASLGVLEIWCYDGSQAYFYSFTGEQYVETSHSRAFHFLTGKRRSPHFVMVSCNTAQLMCRCASRSGNRSLNRIHSPLPTAPASARPSRREGCCSAENFGILAFSGGAQSLVH
jgi:putative restriction endonuclease